MTYSFSRGAVHVQGLSCLDLARTLDGGQAFRWRPEGGGWTGAAGTHRLHVEEENGIYRFFCSLSDFENYWYRYFDLGRNWNAVCRQIGQDPRVHEAMQEYGGIRILRQDVFETLFSFIISQQNNIARIRLILDHICAACGDDLGGGVFGFPPLERLCRLTEADFRALGCGFRAKYLTALCRTAAAGRIDLSALSALPEDAARKELMRLYGVGQKVADCTLLFGLGFLNVVPQDVWMKRVLRLYPNGLPACFDGYAGAAQQYLFYWARRHLKKGDSLA